MSTLLATTAPTIEVGSGALSRATLPSRARIVTVTDENVAAFLGAERAALILSARDCRYCDSYRQGIETLLGARALPGITLGALVVDAPEAREFVRRNDWVHDAEALPYTVLYRAGRRIDGFAAFKPESLLRRMTRLAFLPQPAAAQAAPLIARVTDDDCLGMWAAD